MKKALITILTVLTALLVFVSCTNSVDDYFDPPKPEPVTTKVWKVGTDEFATLQEAVNSIPKGSKDIVYTIIELIASAKGPGAEIDGDVADNIAIDFMGFDFEFTGDFGIKATNDAEVLITNTGAKESKVTLENKTADLVMILSDGASVGIEGTTNLTVAADQYVVSAKEGADVSVGEDPASYVTLSGMIASANDASDTATDVLLADNTKAHLANIALSSANGKTAKVTLYTAKSGQDGLVEILGIQRTTTVDDTKVHVKSTVAGSVIVVNQDIKNTCIVIDEGGDAGAVVVGYEIEYETNGGKLSDAGVVTVYTTDSGSVTLPIGGTKEDSNSVYRLHDETVYDRFDGWYDNAALEGEKIASFDTAGVKGHKKFYAKWTPAYKVTLKTLGGTMTGENVTSYVKGVGATLPAMAPAREKGGAFQGWVTDLTSTTYVTSITAEDEGDKTFYAKFTFSVTFDKNDTDASGTTMEPQEFTVGLKGQNINANTYTKASDWRFIGWATSSEGTVSYDDKAELFIDGDKETVTTLYAIWENHIKYVGKVVLQSGTANDSSAVYITPVFYSQPIEQDPNDTSKAYNVSYNFYYKDGSNSEFVQFCTVKAKEIVAGNGNAEGSTAKLINTAFKNSGASANSVIYYEVVDEKGQYHTNDDDYAAFYMYSPTGSENVYTDDKLTSDGSTFARANYVGYVEEAKHRSLVFNNIYSTTSNEGQPDDWKKLAYNTENPQRLTEGHIGTNTFTTGRTNYQILKNWIGTNPDRKNYYYYNSGAEYSSSNSRTAWDVVDLVNGEEEGRYHDWFIPSFGEIEQMRQPFTSAEYFGKALFGAKYNTNYTGDDCEQASTIITSSVSGTNSPTKDNYYKNAVYWKLLTYDAEEAWFTNQRTYPAPSLVLVRTF